MHSASVPPSLGARQPKEDSMRKFWIGPSLGLVVVALALVLAGWGGSAGEQQASAAAYGSPGLLPGSRGLDDYGIQPTRCSLGVAVGVTDDDAAADVAKPHRIQVVSYGCPEETDRRSARSRSIAHPRADDQFRGSQLKAALSFLRAHPGDVSPITVTLYGNDWLPVLLDTCKATSSASGSMRRARLRRSLRASARSSSGFELRRRRPTSS